MQSRKTILLARPRHPPGHGEAIFVQNPISTAINILATAMQDIGPPRRKIQRMKQAAIRMMHHAAGGTIENQVIAAACRTQMRAEPQLALFVMDQPNRAWREDCPPGQPARQALPRITNPTRDAPRSGKKAAKIGDGIKHDATVTSPEASPKSRETAGIREPTDCPARPCSRRTLPASKWSLC